MAPNQLAAFLTFVRLIGQAVSEAGKQGIPSGHLYAVLMGKITREAYQSIIDLMKRQNLINETGNLLTWTGPEIKN